jgi:hypothetical protein
MLHAFEPGSIPQPREASFPFPQFDRIFVGTGICQALCGALLLLGGLAVRQRRALGPKLIRASLLLALLYVVAFTVMFLPSAFTLSRPGATAFVFMAFAFFNSALWGFLLWLPLRFFSSPRVRMYCQSAAA